MEYTVKSKKHLGFELYEVVLTEGPLTLESATFWSEAGCYKWAQRKMGPVNPSKD